MSLKCRNGYFFWRGKVKRMENKKKLKCVESYEEDLTGNDDYIELWTAGEIYDAIKHSLHFLEQFAHCFTFKMMEYI